MKTQFAATVSHEVRTPLNGVVGMLDLLRDMHLSQPQREHVEMAWNSSQALLDLINGILDFSKLEAGKLELEEIDFDLRELVEGVIELLAKQAQQKGLELGYAMTPAVPARVRGDSLRVRQVLINLLSNAVKFTEHGEVAVHISCSTQSGEDLTLRVEVSDTGIGMDENTVQHVFESFAQADPSTTRKYGGTGLGLAISKHLVALMGGEIGVTSQRAQGTTFWFTIPCKRVETLPLPLLELALEGLSVLVLAESNILRAFLEQSLTTFGMSCRVASKSGEALAELERARQEGAPYGLVIIDANSAEDTELVLCIRSDGTQPTPLLLLDHHRSPLEAHPLQADSYVTKPLRLEPLLTTIRRLLLSEMSHGTVPIAPSQPSSLPASAAPKHRILVVEDNRINQMVAGGMLSKSNCHCEFAANGREALEAVRHRRFDLIFMDCNMPEMDGYEATVHIRNFEKSQDRRTPIVAITANAQAGDQETCLAAGMDDYLAKPITLAKLRQKLEIWLSPQHSGRTGPMTGMASLQD